MTEHIQVIDCVTRVAPLGLYFWDVAAKAPAEPGLTVTTYWKANPTHQYPIIANQTGFYVLQNVDGFWDVESRAGDNDYWAKQTSTRPMIIEVHDPRRRYLPFCFSADIPTQKVWSWHCGSTAPKPEKDQKFAPVPLYSTAYRTPPRGMAVLRADLVDPRPEDPVPAAWAVLEVSCGGNLLGRGISDKDGKLAVYFPYPELQADDGHLSTAALPKQQWLLQLGVYYAPVSPVPDVPILCDTLAQDQGTLWLHWTRPAGIDSLTDVTLEYGQEVIVRSLEASTDKQLSELHVTPKQIT